MGGWVGGGGRGGSGCVSNTVTLHREKQDIGPLTRPLSA